MVKYGLGARSRRVPCHFPKRMNAVPPCDLSVVIATRNRQGSLRQTLQTLIAQNARDVRFEIIVVDNGSTDATRQVTESMARASVPGRYVLEPATGASQARNAGLVLARAPIIGFIDDDEDVPANWVSVVHRAFSNNPDVDMIGGRVLPQWQGTPPSWITPSNRGAVSIIDRGEESFLVDQRRWMCFSGGNMACRQRALDEMGGFSDACRRSEDRELLLRFLLAGRKALYVPTMVVIHRIDASRLTKSHFRRWSRIEGSLRAAYRFEEMFTRDGELRLPPRMPMILGAPRFLYRQLAREWLHWVRACIARKPAEAFRHETRAIYLWNYIRSRRRITIPSPPLLPSVAPSVLDEAPTGP